jgi:hypothetical protein
MPPDGEPRQYAAIHMVRVPYLVEGGSARVTRNLRELCYSELG